ncbi:hypothetical protein FRC00_011731 [Tulasnella sp. 408]|nr:hypothetical protein FRC00_011731 [Tulasnella sp. 408]
MSDADPRAVRGSHGGIKPTSFSLVPIPAPILAAQYVRETSTGTVRFQKDEERTEYDRLSLYLPFDHTSSPPPLTEPDYDEDFSRSSPDYSNLFRVLRIAQAAGSVEWKWGLVLLPTLLNLFWDIRVAKITTQSPLPPERHILEEVQHRLSAASESQISAEALAHLIWSRLSEYEESSLACLSDIAQHVGNGLDLVAIQAVERLVLHIEVLFAAIDELERAGAESLSQTSYAESLLYTASDLIETLSGAQDDGPESYPVPLEIQRERTVQALLALTPSLVSHHKNLMIIVLNGALKLNHGPSSGKALLKFLDRLKRFAMDGANPNADRQEQFVPANIADADAFPSLTTNSLFTRALGDFPSVAVDYSEGVAYGYQSLSPRCAGESPTSPNFILRAVKDGIIMLPFFPSDDCIECLSPINEGCVRLGAYQRWHLQCFACATCGKSVEDTIDSREGSTELWHGGQFEAVTRLEQYAFLLNICPYDYG